MKPLLPSLLLTAVALQLHPLLAENLGTGVGIEFLPKNLPAPSAKVITDDQLRAKLDKEKFGGQQPPDFRPDHFSAENFSDFLLIDGKTCILPKNSVLSIPAPTQAELSPSLTSEILTVTELLHNHRSHITTLNVTLNEAAGIEAINPTKIDQILKSKSIIIAFLNGSPISAPAVKDAILQAIQNQP